MGAGEECAAGVALCEPAYIGTGRYDVLGLVEGGISQAGSDMVETRADVFLFIRATIGVGKAARVEKEVNKFGGAEQITSLVGTDLESSTAMR